MSDVTIYDRESGAKEYSSLVEYLDFYILARKKLIELATKYLPNRKGALADFCCGTGIYSKMISKNVEGGLGDTFLLDINKFFLEEARGQHIETDNITFIEGDVVEVVVPEKTCDVAIAAFAYHHIPNQQKVEFIQQVKKMLKPNGVFIIADVFTEDDHAFYEKVNAEVETQHGIIPGMQKHLSEMGNSSDTEFKVSRTYFDSQIKDSGFEIVEDNKIWPNDDTLGASVGTYVIACKI